MKKRILVCLMAAVFVLSAAGCGSGKDKGSSSSSSSDSSVAGSSTSADGSGSSSSGSSSEGASDGNTVSIIIKDDTLKSVYDAVRGEFGEFWLSMPAVITEQQMKEMYYINPEDIEEFAGEMSIANVSGDTFVMVKAKPGKAQTVAAALEKRRGDIINQFREYPVNFMDLKSEAAKVVTEGDYVFLVLMGDINVPDGEEASLEMAQKEVERAEEAIRSVFSKGSSSAA